MTQSNSIQRPSNERHVSLETCLKKELLLISSIALIALGLVAVGTIALATPENFSNFLRSFKNIYLIGSCLMVGAGGVQLTALSLYGLHHYLRTKGSSQPHPLQSSPSQSSLPGPAGSAIKPPRVSLTKAMQLFKNYNEKLAERYEETTTLSAFLTDYFHEGLNETAQKQLQRVVAIQKSVETEEGDLEAAKLLYSNWLSNPDDQSDFALFGLENTSFGPQYVFIKRSKNEDSLPNLEEFSFYLQSLKDFHIKGMLPPLIEDKEKPSKHLCFAHTLHAALRLFDAEAFQLSKTFYKIHLFQSILTDYPEWKEDATFRAWIASSLIHLEKTLSKVAPEQRNSLQWNSATTFLSIFRHEYFLLEPLPHHREQLVEPPSLQIPSLRLSAQIEYPGIQEVKEASLSSENLSNLSLNSAPTRYPSFSEKEDVKLVEEWKSYLFKLYQSAQLSAENVETQTVQFLLHLPSSSNLESLSLILSSEEKKVLFKSIQEITQLALTLHVALEHITPHPSRFFAFLKGLDHLIILAQAIPETKFHNHTLKTYPFYAALKDCYFDLGPFQKQILDVLDSIKKHGTRETTLSNFDDSAYKVEYELVRDWFNGKNPQHYPSKDTLKKFEEDFTGRFLPKEIAALRNIHFLIKSAIAPETAFDYRAGKSFEKREDFKDHLQGLKEVFHVGSQKLLGNRQELLHLKDNAIFSHLEIPFKAFKQQKGINDFLGPPISPYYNLGGPISNNDIRIRLVEGMVSIVTLEYADQDGNFGCDLRGNDAHALDPASGHAMDGLRQAPFKIHQDKFAFPHVSIEVSRDLQMMASGRDNRASNTLRTFCNHPHLLMHEKHGEDFRHVLRLSLFRDALLIKEMELNPHTAESILGNVKSLLDFYEKVKDFKNWAFIYQIHTDITNALRDSSLHLRAEPMHQKYTEKLLEWIKRGESGEAELFGTRANLHLAYLYAKAILGYQPHELLTIGMSYFAAKTLIERIHLKQPLYGQSLFDFAQQLKESLIDFIEEDLSGLDKLLSYRIKSTGVHKWTRLARGIYQTDTMLIDLVRLQISQKNKVEGPLPRELREDPFFKSLFGEEILSETHTFTHVETSLGKAWHVSLNKKGILYSLYLRRDDPQFPLLFRKKGNEPWEQWRQLSNLPSFAPVDFKKGYAWSHNQAFKVEDPQGSQLYEPHFSPEGGLSSLFRLTSKGKESVLNTSDDRLFSQLDSPDSYIVTKSSSNQLSVTYLKNKNRYTWNPASQRWESNLYRGYFLSNKPLEQWCQPGSQSSAHLPSFFSSHFKNYHILENQDGKGKLILSCTSYQRSSKKVLEEELKYATSLTPLYSSKAPWEQSTTLITFDLEKNGYLQSKRPQDFFYLSYLLYTQGKHGEALLYLHRSAAIWNMTDAKEATWRKQIKDWLLQWKVNDPQATAFKLHFLLLEHQLLESSFAHSDTLLSIDAEFLPPLFHLYSTYQKQESQIDSSLRLNESDKRLLSFLERRSKIDSDPVKAKKALNECLDFYIQQLEKAVEGKKKQENAFIEPSYSPVPLLDIQPWLAPLNENVSSQQACERAQNLAEELKEVFQKETLAGQIGLELSTDIKRHAEKVQSSFTLSDTASLDELKTQLERHQKIHLNEEKALKQRILNSFISQPLDAKTSIERQLKEQEALYDGLFEKARFCFGIQDYSSLVSSRAIAPDQISSFNTNLLNYEIARTNRRLLGRKQESLEKYRREPQNVVLKEECANLLQEWRQYDPHQHPYSPLLLLLEDELNITARSSQMTHIHQLTAHPNSYKHEAMAGGKTTFLRNLFSAIQSQQGQLPGVMTYSPLMAMHHKEYTAVNNLAFGSRAYPLFYNRNMKKDEVTYKLMAIHHLKALLENGRIDQTPQATISLNHTLTELILNLDSKNEQALEEASPKINALQKLLSIRSQHLSVYSDEIDKIFDPLKDYNYSVGKAKILEKEFYQPALDLIRLLKEKSSLKTFLQLIQNNQLPRLSEKEFEKYLRLLAEEAFTEFKFPFEKEVFLDYLTEVHQGTDKQHTVIRFYTEKILQHQDPEQRLQVQMLHSFIGVLLRNMKNKLVGTDFGRSQDQISVKPYSFSAVCQESSQRSFVLATVLEICIDYLVSGITVEGVKSYIECLKEKAAKELDQADSLDETPTGKTFTNRFGKSLSQIQVDSYSTVASKMSASYPLFEECLGEILLKKFTYYEEKIEGHAHHLPHLLAHFSGSSGSPERVKTLPSSINKHQKLIRQEGAIGSVFFALLKNFDEKTDILPFDPHANAENQIKAHLQPGDTFIDNTPFFSGKKGIELVELLANGSSQALYRFLDEQDDICLWDQGHVRKGDEGIDLKNTISIISHKGRQGTNWVFAPGTKGIVEAGVNAELTSFYQSLMRLRLLGKGQTAKIFYDTSLQVIWDKEPALKNKSILTKIIWTLVHNEEPLLKRLHYQANRKQIKSHKVAAIDQIKRSVTNVQTLSIIRQMPSFKLVEKTPLDPRKCGEPITLEKPQVVLGALIQAEKEALLSLKTEILTLTDENSKNIIVKILDETLEKYDSSLIMSPSDLPAFVPSPFSDSEAVEEIEVENEQEQQAEQQLQQEVSLEVETELQLEQDLQAELDVQKSQKHPHSEDGREWSERNQMVSIHFPYTFNQHLKGEDRDGHLLDAKLFPHLYVTDYGLGIYKHPQHPTDRIERLWFYAEPSERTPLSSKAFVIIGPQPAYQMAFFMGSVKDMDFYLYEAQKEKQLSNAWKPLDFASAQKQFKQLPFGQRYIVQSSKKAQEPEKYYNDKAKGYAELKDYQFIKIDLFETDVPSIIPVEIREKWIEKIALMKLLFFEAKFSPAEKNALKKWLASCPFSLEELEKRAKSYLTKAYPSTAANPVLALLKELRAERK